jgi:hypothetical protein
LHLSERDLLKFNKAVLYLHSCRNMHSFHQAVMQGIRLLAPYDAGNVYHVDPNDVYLVDVSINTYHKYLTQYAEHDKDPIKNECLSARLTRSRATRVSDVKKKMEWDEEVYRDLTLPFGIYHSAGIDLIYKGEYAKRIGIHRQTSRPDFTEKELSFLKLYTDQIDLALKRVKAEEAVGDFTAVEFNHGEGVCVLNKLAECVYANEYANRLFQRDNTGVYRKLMEISRHVIRLAKADSRLYHYGGCLDVHRQKLNFEFTPCRGTDSYLNFILSFSLVEDIVAEGPQIVSLATVKK